MTQQSETRRRLEERNCWHGDRPYDPECLECQKLIYHMIREAEGRKLDELGGVKGERE